MSELLQQAREIMYQTPSQGVWEQLVTTMSGQVWEDYPDKEMVLDYVQEHLKVWPDELRIITDKNNHPWLKPLLIQNIHSIQLRLVTTLNLSWQTLRYKEVLALANSSSLSQLQFLDLGYNRIGDECKSVIKRVFESKGIKSVTGVR